MLQSPASAPPPREVEREGKRSESVPAISTPPTGGGGPPAHAAAPARPRARVVEPGEFEAPNHYYPRALNAHLHPIVASFLALGNERICTRYSHLNPRVDAAKLRDLLAYQSRHFLWAGSDLFNAMTPQGQRQMIMVETNSCPSGQKSMPLMEGNECGGYGVVLEGAFGEMLRHVPPASGVLAVLYDKNWMEASGYACVMAERFRERVWLVEYSVLEVAGAAEEARGLVRWFEGRLHVREDVTKAWVPVRACFRYVTQKPWNRFPVHSKTLVLNSVLACLAGGRNKMMAARAYELLNNELAGSGLTVRMPYTVRNVLKEEIPGIVDSMGGHAVIKVPYSNAGQGVYTITNARELGTFMQLPHHYDKFIVQSLVGNASWTTPSPRTAAATAGGIFSHVGTIPDKRNQTFVSDLRMMVVRTSDGFRPVACYARRARKPLPTHLSPESEVTSWEMLGTNLSYKTPEGEWRTEAERLLLMDCKDFNQLGIGLDELIDAYVQTVLSVVAIDKMAERLLIPREGVALPGGGGKPVMEDPFHWVDRRTLDVELFATLNPDPMLLEELWRD